MLKAILDKAEKSFPADHRFWKGAVPALLSVAARVGETLVEIAPPPASPPATPSGARPADVAAACGMMVLVDTGSARPPPSTSGTTGIAAKIREYLP